MFGLGPREIIILAIVLVLFFGSKKIPELARGIGDAIRHIKNGFSDEGPVESKGKEVKDKAK